MSNQKSKTTPAFGGENPMSPNDDPIVELIERPFSSMTDDELEAHIDKLNEASNNPRAFSRLVKGKSKKKAKKSKNKAEDLLFEKMLENL